MPATTPPTTTGTPKSSQPPTMPPGKTWLWFVLILVANLFVARMLLPSGEGPVTVSYTLFKQEVAKNNVQAIHSRGDTITGRFKTAITYSPPSDKRTAPNPKPESITSFSTTLPSFVDPGLEAFLIGHGVEISAKPLEESRNPWSTLIFGFGPTLLFIGFYVWLFRRASKQGGGLSGFMGIGKSRARRYDQAKDTKVTFDDVAGIDEAEHELIEIVDFLKDPAKYTRLGGTA